MVTSVYNSDNLLTSRELGGTGVTALRADFTYDSANEMTSETRYANLAGTTVVGVTSYGYDTSGNLTTITLQNSSGTTLAYYDYQYDNDNRVTQESWASTTSTGTLSGSVTYGYDAASQLTKDGSTTYSYDDNGNRTNSGYSTGTGNELTTDGTYNYSYDADGNLIQKVSVSGLTTWTYGYSVANQLTSIVETTSGSTVLQVTYTYDVLGRRVAQSEWIGGTATVTRFAYDDNGNVWAELSSSNAVQTRYLWGDGTDQILGRVDGTTAYWYQTDNLGSVRDVFASSGSLTYVSDTINYSAFGVITLETNSSVGGRLKYTAEPWDANTGLQLDGRRYYDPATGQWTSQDPAGVGSNLYQYVGNDPTNATDSSGEFGRFRCCCPPTVYPYPVPVQPVPTMPYADGGRILERTVSVTLRLPDGSTTQLKIGLNNFTFRGGNVLVEQIVRVRYDLYSAVADLSRFISNKQFPQRIARWFTGRDFKRTADAEAKTVQIVKDVYDSIINLIDDGIDYYDDTTLPRTNYGRTPGKMDSTSSIGPKFCTCKPSVPRDVERYGTIIHELSHAAFPGEITDDGGLFNSPGALRGEPLKWYEDAENTKLLAEQPDTGTLLDNADAYAGYLTQYYYRWGPI